VAGVRAPFAIDPHTHGAERRALLLRLRSHVRPPEDNDSLLKIPTTIAIVGPMTGDITRTEEKLKAQLKGILPRLLSSMDDSVIVGRRRRTHQ